MRLQLTAGHPPRPSAEALSRANVPDTLILRALAPAQRESLLSGLATGGDTASARHVAEETNAISLRETLERALDRRSLGLIVSTLDLEWLLTLGAQRGVEISDLLARSDTVSRRGLTRFERQRIDENFGRTVDTSTIRFAFSTGVQTMGAGALVLGNTLHIDPTDPRWNIQSGTTLNASPEDESWNSFNTVLLAHEPTHIWSYQHQGSRYAINSVTDQLTAMQTGNRNGAYRYQPDKAHLTEFAEEQRAMLMQDFVCATRSRARGDATSFCLYGGIKPCDEIIATLKKYVDQLRAMGPGMAEPTGRTVSPILCACVQPFTQDGLAGFLGSQGSALVGAAGREATKAIVEGVARKDSLEVAAGLAGVGAAIAASFLPREQSADGAHSGGSAILDQANIPHGLEVGRDGVTVSTKVSWDAPVKNVGMGDPRTEWGVGVHRDLGEVRVDADARATVAFTGEVQKVGGSVRLEQGGTSFEIAATIKPQAGSAWGHLELISDEVSVTATGTLGREAASASTSVETKAFGVDVSTTWKRAHPDAPLEVSGGTLGAHVNLRPGLTLGAGATFVPTGIDGVTAELGVIDDLGSLSIRGEGSKLMTAATLGIAVAATESKSGVSVMVSGQSTPSTGEVQGAISVTVPLK